MFGVFRWASALAAPLAGRVIGRRLKQGKEDPARIFERRGIVSVAQPPGPLVWIHGDSVGEDLAAAELVERVRALNLRVLLTSGTRTSAEIVARRFPPDVIHQFIPFDVPAFVERFLDHWKPCLALFIESDLWPNLLLSAAEKRVPLVLINGRMSPRSYPRWRKARGTISALLSCFDLCLTQTNIDLERFAALGSPIVMTSGNLKLDIKPLPADPQRIERLKAATGRRTVFVAASTHPGEEEIIIDAHRRLAADIPSRLTIIVPRHPQRGPAGAQLAAASGLQVQLRSRGHLHSADTDIYVADTMGELGMFYRIAPVVFMGGSLVMHGGQNPIEPAKLDAAILHGPHVFNFSDIYAALDGEEGALLAHDPEEFVTLLRHLLGNPIARNRHAASAQGVVTRHGGAVDKTMAALEPYLLQMRIEQGATDA